MLNWRMQKREAIRYFENAKEILSKTPIENNIYADIKPVQEACSTAYLAVLKAIDEYLLKKGLVPLNKGGLRGLLEKELPQSIDAYRNSLKKHLAIHLIRLSKPICKNLLDYMIVI